jgi:hypothetical protein
VRPSTRRIGVRDVMILIAATALGLALLRLRITLAKVPLFLQELTRVIFSGRSFAAKVVVVTGVLELINPVVFAWTAGIVVIRILPPRPRLRRLAAQPGFIACAMFLAAALFAYAILAFTIVTRGRLRVPLGTSLTPALINYHGIATLLSVQQGGWAVAVAWLMLALAGRWAAEPSWIDRLGRALGVFWLAAAIILTDFHNSVIIP